MSLYGTRQTKHTETQREEIAIPEQELPGSRRDLQGETDLQWGLIVLENDPSSITVAAYAGDHYTLQTEAARVRLQLDTDRSPVAHIVEFREANFAVGESRRTVLRYAEYLAARRGVKSIEASSLEDDFTRLPASERRALIRDLQEEGYLVRYYTRTIDGRRELRPLPGQEVNPHVVEGEPLSINAVKNLEADRPRPPDWRIRVADAATEQFKQELAGVQEGWLPDELHLPAEVSDQLEALWEKSVKRESSTGERVHEYAATMVKDQTGKVTLKYEVKGDSNSVRPEETVAENERLIGWVHTHPYENGLTDIAFSGGDFAYLLTHEGAQICIVRSGDSVFALVKTENTVHVLPNQYEAIRKEIEGTSIALQEEELQGESRQPLEQQSNFADTVKNIIVAVNMEACERYGLILYHGKVGESLRRVYP